MEGLKTYPSVITISKRDTLIYGIISLLVLATCFLGFKVYSLSSSVASAEKFLDVATQNQYTAFKNGTLPVNQK